jgi:hypothetical protein
MEYGEFTLCAQRSPARSSHVIHPHNPVVPVVGYVNPSSCVNGDAVGPAKLFDSAALATLQDLAT